MDMNQFAQDLKFALRGFEKGDEAFGTWRRKMGNIYVVVSANGANEIFVSVSCNNGHIAFKGLKTMEDLDRLIEFIGDQDIYDAVLSLAFA